MRNISSFDDIIDIRDIIARVEELREQRVARFVAGFNMPGYMPDCEPCEFDNAEDAKRSIIESIKHAGDSADSESLADNLAAFAEEVNLESGEFSVQGPDGFVYWVTEDGTMGLDDDEIEELANLEALLAECKDAGGGDEQWDGDWYPVTLIRESYFKDYAQELADDIGAIKDSAQWPYTCIDWNQAAMELKMDYIGVEFDGVTYFTR